MKVKKKRFIYSLCKEKRLKAHGKHSQATDNKSHVD